MKKIIIEVEDDLQNGVMYTEHDGERIIDYDLIEYGIAVLETVADAQEKGGVKDGSIILDL